MSDIKKEFQCKGKGCKSVDGVSHSKECEKEHNAAYSGSPIVTLDKLTEQNKMLQTRIDMFTKAINQIADSVSAGACAGVDTDGDISHTSEVIIGAHAKLVEQNKMLREALQLVSDIIPMSQNANGGGYMVILSNDDCRIIKETLNISEL